MKISTIRTLCGLLLALWLVIGPQARSACAGIAVSPLKQEIVLRPGEEGKVTITLAYNTRLSTDIPQAARLSILDVVVTEDGSLNFREGGALKNSASKWVTIDHMDVLLEPGKSQNIECKIAPPLSAAAGEYYTTVMVTLATKTKSDKGVMVQYRIASGIFVTVLGRTFPKEAKIARCELTWPQGDAAIPEETPTTRTADDAGEEAPKSQLPAIKVLLQNVGQARFDATGKVTVLDDQSRMAFTSPLTSKRACVFGGDGRLFQADITKPLPAGRYTIRVEMDYQSAWAKARQDMRVEIMPEQAALLASLRKQQRDQARLLELPETLSTAIPAGATRSVTFAVKNLSEGSLSCKGSLPAGAGIDSWMNLRPMDFTLTKGAKKTLEVRVQVPKDARIGKYTSAITLDAGPDGSAHSQMTIPFDIDVKTER